MSIHIRSPNSPCTVGTGACAREGHTVCGGLDTTTCDATPGPPEAEGCNGLDDDCDGEPDDGDALLLDSIARLLEETNR